MKLLILGSVLCSLLGVAATCTTGVRQHGEGGPWTGEVTNTGTSAVYGVSATGDIFDANGLNLFGRVGVMACPSKLLPGERGAFELNINDPDFNPLAGAPPDYVLPLRAEMQPLAQENVGTGQARGDGLYVRETGRSAGSSIAVDLVNNSGASYSQFTVCAIARDANGELMLARADGPHLPFQLQDGDAHALELVFRREPVGTVRFHALGLWNAPYQPCCPANGTSTWSSVDTGPFSVLLPSGWVYEPLQGIDSFVGQFRGDGVTLGFDYGWYSGDPEDASGPPQDVHLETIGGREVKIVVATGPTGTTGIYTQVEWEPPDDCCADRLSMYAQDLTEAQKATVMQIFRSLRFDEP